MDIIILFFYIGCYIWLLFYGGAERLQGSLFTALLFYPEMTAKQLKFYASLSLALIPIYFYFL